MQKLRFLFFIVAIVFAQTGQATGKAAMQEAIAESEEKVDELDYYYDSNPVFDLELGRTHSTPVAPESKEKKDHHFFDDQAFLLLSNKQLGAIYYNLNFSRFCKNHLFFIYPSFNFW